MLKKKCWVRGGPGRLPAEEAAKVEDRLLDAALELLNERSFADTTMEQIARRAGASTKTLYSRYASKAEVMQAVVNRIIERTLTAAALDPTLNDPRSFILTLGTQALRSVSKEGVGLIQIALGEARRHPEIARLYKDTLARGRAIFTQALAHWHAQGLLPDLKDPAMSAALLISMLTDMARIRSAMGEPMDDAEIAAHVPFAADLFLRGCGYRPNAAPL